MRVRLVLLGAVLLAAVGCSSPPPPQPQGDDNLVKKPPPLVRMSGAPTETRSGDVRIWDVSVGKGAPVKKGQQATIQYVLWLTDGTRLDSSRARGRAFTFEVGGNNSIPGISIGVIGMKPGGKRRIEVPPELGYGAADKGPIPANSTLLFDVELVEAK